MSAKKKKIRGWLHPRKFVRLKYWIYIPFGDNVKESKKVNTHFSRCLSIYFLFSKKKKSA